MRCNSGGEGIENDDYGRTGWELDQKMNVAFERGM